MRLVIPRKSAQQHSTQTCYDYSVSSKSLAMIGMIVGSLIGGYIPVLFGADLLSLISVITTAIGGILGVWLALKISD